MGKVGLKTTDAVSVGLFGSSGPVDITVTKAAFQQKTGKEKGTKYVVLSLNFNDSEGNAKSQDYAAFPVGKDSKGDNIPLKVTNGGAEIEGDTEDKNAVVALKTDCDYVKLINSLKQHGFNESALDSQGVFALNGIKGKASREKLGTKRTGTDGKEYDDYGPLVFVVLDPKTVGQAAKAAGAAAGGGEVSEVDYQSEAINAVSSLLESGFKGNPALMVAKVSGLPAVKALVAADRTKVTGLIKSEAFWEEIAGIATYDGKVLLKAAE